MSTRRTRCGKCDGCLAVECRKCKHCLDMKKNGGPGNLRRPCVDRVCRAIQAAPTKKEVAERNKPKSEYGTYKGGEEQKGGGLEGQLAAERCRAEAAKHAKAPPPPRVIGGETFVCKDFIRLAKALEVTMRGDGSLDYEAASAILLKEEPARVKYIEKLKEEVRLWDEGVPEEITPDWVPEARKAADAEEKRQQRWTPARCRALWRWGAYGYDEKAEGVLDLAESDDDIVTSFLDPLTMAVGKRAPGPARDADTYLGVADPDTRVPREIDEKELEAIRAKYPAPPSPPPAPPPPPPPPPAGVVRVVVVVGRGPGADGRRRAAARAGAGPDDPPAVFRCRKGPGRRRRVDREGVVQGAGRLGRPAHEPGVRRAAARAHHRAARVRDGDVDVLR